MRRFNPGNFYCGTTAEWTSCPRPVRHPDHMSGLGSDYWYGESGVVRYSDHWGSEVASCDWYLDGVARCSFDDHDGWRCGFAPWTEFELKTFEVTVYHPDLLPSESAAALGDPVRSGVAPAWRPGMADIPYASYRVRPDMIVDDSLFKNNKFQDYLQAGRIVFDTFQEAHNVIENTDFGESVEYSSLGSHKSMKDYDIDTIMRLSNDAVLFAMLCQQYVQFKKQGV